MGDGYSRYGGGHVNQYPNEREMQQDYRALRPPLRLSPSARPQKRPRSEFPRDFHANGNGNESRRTRSTSPETWHGPRNPEPPPFNGGRPPQRLAGNPRHAPSIPRSGILQHRTVKNRNVRAMGPLSRDKEVSAPKQGPMVKPKPATAPFRSTHLSNNAGQRQAESRDSRRSTVNPIAHPHAKRSWANADRARTAEQQNGRKAEVSWRRDSQEKKFERQGQSPHHPIRDSIPVDERVVKLVDALTEERGSGRVASEQGNVRKADTITIDNDDGQPASSREPGKSVPLPQRKPMNKSATMQKKRKDLSKSKAKPHLPTVHFRSVPAPLTAQDVKEVPENLQRRQGYVDLEHRPIRVPKLKSESKRQEVVEDRHNSDDKPSEIDIIEVPDRGEAQEEQRDVEKRRDDRKNHQDVNEVEEVRDSAEKCEGRSAAKVDGKSLKEHREAEVAAEEQDDCVKSLAKNKDSASSAAVVCIDDNCTEQLDSDDVPDKNEDVWPLQMLGNCDELQLESIVESQRIERQPYVDLSCCGVNESKLVHVINFILSKRYRFSTKLTLYRNNLVSVNAELCDKLNDLKIGSLDMSVNRIYSIHNSLSLCKQLHFLDLSRNRLSELPGGLCEITGLRVLDLAGNRLKTLPKGFARLKRLQILNLSQNRLTELPDDWAEDDMDLSALDVSRNKQFEWFPKCTAELKKLIDLHFSGTTFEASLRRSDLRLSPIRLMRDVAGKRTTDLLTRKKMRARPGKDSSTPDIEAVS